MESQANAYGTSVRKMARLFRLFTPEEAELTGPQIAERLGLHKSTTYRILAAACDEGLLAHDSITGKYSVGPFLYLSGILFLRTNDLLQPAAPVIKLLNELTREVANMSILNESFITIVLREESFHDFRWSRHVGSIIPAHTSSMGWSLLSDLPDSEIDRLYPDENLEALTPKTIVTRTALKRELARVRETGVAYDYEGALAHMVGIGSPVWGATGRVVAGISVTAPIFRVDEQQVLRIGELVRQGARLISSKLGHRGDNSPIMQADDLRAWWDEACRSSQEQSVS